MSLSFNVRASKIIPNRLDRASDTLIFKEFDETP
jgi:hypothetical protein